MNEKRELRQEIALAAALLMLLVLMVACLVSLHARVEALEKRAEAESACHVTSAVDECGTRTQTMGVGPEIREMADRCTDYCLELAQENAEKKLSERNYVIQVLTAEAGTDELLCGCVAQCLYNACEKHGWVYGPADMMRRYQYTEPLGWYSAAAEKAWDDVFCSGLTYGCVGNATVFYAPAYCAGAWHESQRFVFEYGGVRFFEEIG